MSFNENQYWRPDAQDWAVQQERMRHTQALFNFGEYAVFVLMWQITDFEGGYVDRCSFCWKSYDKIAEAYGQSAQTKCPNCFGTTFEGGYKAILVRPAIWNQTEENILTTRSGEIVTATATVQSTEDFLMNGGDYIFRANGTRWETAGPAADTDYLHTGFQYSQAATQSVGFNYQRVVRADETAVAYLIPPLPVAVNEMLAPQAGHAPVDYSIYEEIRGPLL